MKKNKIIINYESYTCKLKYIKRGNILHFSLIHTSFISKYSEGNDWQSFCNNNFLYLSRHSNSDSIHMDYVSFVYDKEPNASIKQYLYNLKHNIPQKDSDGEWCINIRYEK